MPVDGLAWMTRHDDDNICLNTHCVALTYTSENRLKMRGEMVKSSMAITVCYEDRFKESYRDVVEQTQRVFRDPSSPESHDLLFSCHVARSALERGKCNIETLSRSYMTNSVE